MKNGGIIGLRNNIVQYRTSGVYSLSEQYSASKSGLWEKSIVRDGLVLWLDASHPNSYPGAGTTWFDLSGNGYDIEIVGSPEHNPSGYFKFEDNQVTQYMIRSPFEIPTENITFSCWFRSNFSSNQQTPFTYSVNGNNEMLMFTSNRTTLRPHPKGSATTVPTSDMKDVWINFTWSREASTGNNRFYRDGELIGTRDGHLAGTPITAGGYLLIGQEVDGAGVPASFDPNQNLDGDFAQLSIYSKILSPAEVGQNYNALRNRFRFEI
jgi:hypothetical protein